MFSQLRSNECIRFWSVFLLLAALLFAPALAGGEDDPAVGSPESATVEPPSSGPVPEAPPNLTDLLVWWLTLGLLF